MGVEKMKKNRFLALTVFTISSGFLATTLAISPAVAQTEITFWHAQSDGAGPKMIQDAVDRFEADNPTIKVVVSPVGADAIKDKIKVAIGAGSAPCIFPSWGGGVLNEYVKAGAVFPLNAYVKKDNYKNRFVPASWSNVTFSGAVYGIPVENSAFAAIWYNKAIFKKYNLKPAKTWPELMTIVKTLNKAKIAPFTLGGSSKWPSIMWYDYLVDRIDDDAFAKAALRTGGSFQDPAFIQAGKMIQDLVKANGFIKGYNGILYENSVTPLYQGKAAMYLMGNWIYGQFVNDKKSNEYAFFNFPSVPGGKGDPSNVVGTIGDNYYSISANCPDKENAFKVIQYLIDDKSVTSRIAQGRIPPVKGIKLTDPNTIELNKIISSAKGVQLWWDQYLPAEFAELHKNETAKLFGLSTTPEKMAAAQEALARKILG
jgi:raffinose/stachyose/melibiose transport system substrate-binding protein